MIDRGIKRSLGQMISGVQVVGAAYDGEVRAYCSHWVTQVSFEEPIVMASMSPKHDTYPLVVGSGLFSVSILAADQIAEGQYFSYPGRRFKQSAPEYLEIVEGLPVVPNCVAWLRCEVLDRVQSLDGDAGAVHLDHDLFFARVTATGEGRLREPPLLYSSRLGWRATGTKARENGESIRDRLLLRLEEQGDGRGG